jgi:UDPglucose 6-dehydrogenase/GDP-mannose 6-dehydrogenase
LSEILSRCVKDERLRASCDTAAAVASSDITFLAVGTPSNADGIDLSYLLAAAEEVGKGLRETGRYQVIVVKSTVTPGTTDTQVRCTIERASGLQAGSFGLCMNPEFLREGSAVDDFMNPDRIVIGRYDQKSGARLAEAYSSFECPKLFTTTRNAEMIKYASNALLATLVSFSNEFAAICEATPETDVEEVLNALHLDRRFASSTAGRSKPADILTYLRAGCGFGGSCLPKDLAAIRHYARHQKVVPKLLDAVAEVNSKRAQQILALTQRAIGPLQGCTVAVLGLAFKPGTDDLRDSPGLALINLLKENHVAVRAYDPMISSLTGIDAVNVCESATEALQGADAVIIATAWPEFTKWNWTELCAVMRLPVIVDGRNVLVGVPLPDSAIYVVIGRYFEPQEAAVGK